MDADLVVPAQIAGVPLKADVHEIVLAGFGFDTSIAEESLVARIQKQKQLVQRSQPGEWL